MTLASIGNFHMLVYRKNTDAPVRGLADGQIRLAEPTEARNFERYPLK